VDVVGAAARHVGIDLRGDPEDAHRLPDDISDVG
jgi:hypothetical protein